MPITEHSGYYNSYFQPDTDHYQYQMMPVQPENEMPTATYPMPPTTTTTTTTTPKSATTYTTSTIPTTSGAGSSRYGSGSGNEWAQLSTLIGTVIGSIDSSGFSLGTLIAGVLTPAL